MWNLIIPSILISSISIIELFTINKTYGLKQIFFTISGIITMLILKNTKSKKIRDYAGIFYWSILVILLLLCFKKGVSRWFKIGFLNFQPSEFAKLALIMIFSNILEKYPHNYKTFFITGFLSFLYFVSTALQPDLGTALIFALLFLWLLLKVNFNTFLNISTLTLSTGVFTMFYHKIFVVYLFALPFLIYMSIKKFFETIVLSFAILLTIGMSSMVFEKGLKDYQKRRIKAFLYPEKYSRTYAWQIVQSKIAIGSGGLFGKGINKGTQKGLAFLPAAHTDFIFSTIVEEMGFVGGIAVIVSLFILSFTLLKLSEKLEEFEKYFAYLSAGYFFIQSSINLGCALGLLPPVGIPLPFASYGGSHTLAEFITIGINLSFLTKNRRNI